MYNVYEHDQLPNTCNGQNQTDESWLNLCAAQNVQPFGTRIWKLDYFLGDCN